MTPLNGFQRLIVWASLACTAALTWVAVVQPVVEWRIGTNDRLIESQMKARRLVSSIAALEKQNATLASGEEIGDLWIASSEAEATALVQAELSSLARRSGISLRSMAPLQSPEMPLVSAVAFRIEAELTLDRLVQFLQTVEFQSPLLMIERANIRRLARGAVNSVQPTVFVQLDVVAPVRLPEEEL